MTGPSIQSTTGPSTSGPLISEASLVPTIPMISTGMPRAPSTFLRHHPDIPRSAHGADPPLIPRAKTQLDANICVVDRGMKASTSDRTRPLVAVGYGPRCVPVMQLAEAAAGLCDLLWMIDITIPGMLEMADLLNRFGPVIETGGFEAEQITKALSTYEPDGITTYLDAGMVDLAQVAGAMGLPFHSQTDGDRRSPTSRASAGCWPKAAWPCRPATWSGPISPSGTWPPSSRRSAGPPSSNPGRPREAALPSWPRMPPSWPDCSTRWARDAPTWSSRATWATTRPGRTTPTPPMCRSKAWWPPG